MQLVPDSLKKIDSKKLRSHTQISDNALDWWDFTFNDTWIYYFRATDYLNKKTKHQEFSSEIEFFAFDPDTKTAYYHFLGID